MAQEINATTAFDSVQFTLNSAAKTLITLGFSKANVDSASRCLIFVNTDMIRVRWDGLTPTTTSGAKISNATEIIGNENIKNLKLVRDNNTDSEIFVVLEK